MSIGGVGCLTSTDTLFYPAYTWLDKNSPIDVDGIISRFCARMWTDVIGKQIKFKIFRQSGININFVGESEIFTLYTDGTNTFEGSPISVLAGDFVGIHFVSHFNSSYFGVNHGSSALSKAHGLDVTFNTPESEWSSHGYSVALYFSVAQGIYVNSSTGSDSNAGDSCVAGHPVLTFGKAYSLLASGGTIHVCNSGADFSAETVTLNKSFSIDISGGGAGNFYMPKAS